MKPNSEARKRVNIALAAPAMLAALKEIPGECNHTWPHTLACWVCKKNEAIRLAESGE